MKTPQKDSLKNHKFLLALAALVVLVVAWCVVVSIRHRTFSPIESVSTGSSDTSDSDSGVQTIRLGQPASVGNFQFTVKSIRCDVPSITDSTGQLTKRAQGQFCLLSIKAKNIGIKALRIDMSQQSLYDADGKQYTVDSTAVFYANLANGLLDEINPGLSANGVLIFDLPKGVLPTQAALNDGDQADDIRVNLQ